MKKKNIKIELLFQPTTKTKKVSLEKINIVRLIKLIWDFRGEVAAKTAEHHEKHLKEYIQIEKFETKITGFEILNEIHAISFMIVNDYQMIAARDSLKPHRGELYLE